MIPSLPATATRPPPSSAGALEPEVGVGLVELGLFAGV